MNIIAIDIGNTNIDIGLFIEDRQEFIESISGDSQSSLKQTLVSAWNKIPFAKSAREKTRDGVIVVSSVKKQWTTLVRKIAREELGEKIYVIGKDIPLPIETAVAEPAKVGTDRLSNAAAAYVVVEDFVVVADFGSAVTIDLVDGNGVFLGGVICPGFDMSAEALKSGTSQLPKVSVEKPKVPYGSNTDEAINCGLYYSAIGLLREITTRYAEQIGQWPQVVLTGTSAKMIKDDCDFVDNYVPNLVIKGIVLAYRRYIDGKNG